MSSTHAFWFELRRRKVLRAGVLYLGAVWALAQGAAQLLPVFGVPDWVTRWFVVAAAIGFPFWLGFAWFYELTPGGFQPGNTVVAGEFRERRRHRKLDYWILGLLCVVAAALLAGSFFRHDGTGSQAVPADAVPMQSVAVLPLANASGDKDEQYFSDGLSEDLITALSQFAALKVISRNSAFRFRDSKESPAAIGAKLGVAHLLEGSVRRLGDTVRISATLVKAADGSTVWSRRYDRPDQDLFALQDDITAAVAGALEAKLLASDGAIVQSDRPPGGSLDAYNAYLRGNANLDLETEEGQHKGIDALNEAIRLDPRYAAAYARLVSAWIGLANQFLGGAEAREAHVRARAAVNTALALDSNLAQAHRARSWLLASADMDWAGAEAESRRALQLAPHDGQAQFGLGDILATLGQLERAVELTRQALRTDPHVANWHAWLAAYLLPLGRYDEAGAEIETAIGLQPQTTYSHLQLAIIEILRGDPAAALAAARREPPGIWRNVALALAMQVGGDRAAADTALAVLIERNADTSAYQIAEVHALRGDPDRMFEWLERAWVNRDTGIGTLLYDPFILRYRADPRFAAYCTKVGLPSYRRMTST